MKKILIRGLIIGLIIVIIACIGGMGEQVLTFFVPPRLYIVLGLIVIIILLKILQEVRNNGKGNKDE